MRFGRTALMSLVLVGAVQAVGVGQVLTPFEGKPWPRYNERLDYAVPVVTVSRVGDIVALAGARVVEDDRGEPFVLGKATLDLRDPSHAKVVFTMTNATEAPILFKDLPIGQVRLCSTGDGKHPFAYPSVHGRTADGMHDPRSLQPAERVTIQIPVAPYCRDTLGIIVHVGRPGPGEWSSTPALRADTYFRTTKELFFRVFDRLRTEATTSENSRR
jgi:hypothetical protein